MLGRITSFNDRWVVQYFQVVIILSTQYCRKVDNMTENDNKEMEDPKTSTHILAFQKAKILEKHKQIEALKNQVAALENENNSIKKSISFKVGSTLMAPLRFIMGLFAGKVDVNINPIKASCDAAFWAAGLLEVSGWALADEEIDKVEVYANNQLLGAAVLGIHRNDVQQAFKDQAFSEKSGFNFQFNTSSMSEVIEIRIIDQSGHELRLEKVVIPATHDMSLNAQYQIFLQLQNHKDLGELQYKPLISIIVPVYNVEPQWLDRCIDSVLKQSYQNWQLCLFDDASDSEPTRQCLQRWQQADDRINVAFGKSNRGISLASNAAIAMATGEFVGLLDHDDELTTDALYQVAVALNKDQSLDFIYSDEDKIDHLGQFCDPHFKSDFNLAALLSHNYICHFAVIRKSLGEQLHWFRAGFEGSQDHDLFLRVCTQSARISHIPKVLYHWRKIAGSTAITTHNKSYAASAGIKSVEHYLASKHLQGTVSAGMFANSYRIKWSHNNALVSIIIPFKDQLELLKKCTESLLALTAYPNFEILLVNNQSRQRTVIDYCHALVKGNDNIALYDFDEPFNFSRINNFAVPKTQGDLLLFLNNDIEIIDADWLDEMVAQIQQPSVAAVGAQLLFADDTIQHAGIVVSAIAATHINKHLPQTANGYFQRNKYVQHISACTAACLLVKKEVFIDVGGFDEELFAVAYNDVDLCLKMREQGHLITYTPYAKLYHHESKSRGYDESESKLERFNQEIGNYQKKWGHKYQGGDPYFNPNLKANAEKISLDI
ncbi:MAG TPA: glycosyltransferase family 2 protein [Oceanospirillales bacterium]|nr:glycosyltransferase family 2 protein [Oceanospirillales bacterium]